MDIPDDELFTALVIQDGRFEELCNQLEKGIITIHEFKKKVMQILEELVAKYNSISNKGKIVH
ncbi:MAG: hypothetical protein ACLPSL_11290 [Smithella sp.]